MDSGEYRKTSIIQESVDLGQQGFSLYLTILQKTSNKQDKQDIRQSHELEGKKFIDPQFPPDASSLAKDFSLMDYSKEKEWRTFIFKDIDEIYPQPIKVFDSISPNDILQGQLGDCYFLSTLSAIAEFPKRIERCFDTHEYQSSGCYTINMFDMGVETDFVVDDFFPCTPDNKIAFSGPKVEKGVTELWVLLLEKAWAKRFGSYWAIDAGATEDSLRDLTGAPCENIEVTESRLWDKLNEANSKNFIITAASSGEEGCGDLVNEMGLVNFHAYAIIDAQEVDTNTNNTKKKKEQLLKIRNPWGETEWKGDWSDKSSLWTDELKLQLKWENKNDGSFWMSLKDFSHYFFGVTICRVHDEYFYKAVHRTQKKGEFSVFRVRIEKGGETYFIVTHMDKRKFADEEYDYSPLRIVVGRVGEAGVDRVEGMATAFMRDSWLVINAEPGEYLVYVEVSWVFDYTDMFGFTVYSASPIDLSESTFQHEDFIEKVYSLQLALKQGKKKDLLNGIEYYELLLDDKNPSTNEFFEGVYLDAFINTTKEPFTVQVIHKSFKNICLTGKFKDSDSYKFTLAPGGSFTMIKKKVDLTASAKAPISLKKL